MSGAILGVGAAELLRNHNKNEGKDVAHGWGRFGHDIGGGVVGAVAANEINKHRSKSRSRTVSYEDDSHRDGRGRSRSRGRSQSRARSRHQSRGRSLSKIGWGAAAAAGALALARSKSRGRQRSRSSHRRGSTSSHHNDARSKSHRRKREVEGGLAGAAVAGIVDQAISRSRSRPRSRSAFRKALPILAGGAGGAVLSSYYEKNKANKLDAEEEEDEIREGRRLRSRTPSRVRERRTHISESSAPATPGGMIEYGHRPLSGNIPSEDYFGQPVRRQPEWRRPSASGPVTPFSPGYDYPSYRSRSRSRLRLSSDSDSSSSDASRRRRRSRERSSSRGRHLAEAGVAAAGAGYAAHKYADHRRRRKAEERNGN